MAAFTFNDLLNMKDEGPGSHRWKGSPDRTSGSFPFPSDATPYLTKVVEGFETEDGVPVLQAAWRFGGDQKIYVCLGYGYVEGNRIIESETIRLGPIAIDSLNWKPDPETAIISIDRSPCNFASRPKIAAMFPSRTLVPS